MKLLLVLTLFITSLFAIPTRHEFDSLVYYLESPSDEGSFPLMIALEGSYTEEIGPRGILGLHQHLAPAILDAKMILLTMDRRGVDGAQINIATYHQYNTPTQRLKDHLSLIRHLRQHPPKNWNGKLIILGGSEGGPIAIKLARAVNPSACVVIVGCGDQTFKEYIWNTLLAINDPAIAGFPLTRDSYDAQIAKMKANPDPTQFWFGQSYLYWTDALDQTEYREFLELRCPVFVVAGSADIECDSTDRLIALAKQKGQDVTYLRVEGMGHSALDPQWKVMDVIIRLLSREVY